MFSDWYPCCRSGHLWVGVDVKIWLFVFSSLIPHLYTSLKSEGVSFGSDEPVSMGPLPNLPCFTYFENPWSSCCFSPSLRTPTLQTLMLFLVKKKRMILLKVRLLEFYPNLCFLFSFHFCWFYSLLTSPPAIALSLEEEQKNKGKSSTLYPTFHGSGGGSSKPREGRKVGIYLWLIPSYVSLVIYAHKFFFLRISRSEHCMILRQ